MLAEVPVVVYTTTGSSSEIQAVTKLGASYLQKTFDFRSLVTNFMDLRLGGV